MILIKWVRQLIFQSKSSKLQFKNWENCLTMAHQSFSWGDPLRNWNFKKWLANHLSQPESQQCSSFDGKLLGEVTIADIFPLEKCKPSLVCKVIIYVLEAIQILVMLALCVASVKPILNLHLLDQGRINLFDQRKANENHVYVGVIMGVRALSSLAHILLSKLRSNWHYMINKLVQVICLILFRVPFHSFLFPFLCLTCLIEFGSDLVYILCKQQRRGYVDSRLNYNRYITRMLGSLASVIIFNMLKPQYNTAMMIFLLIIAFVHFLHIAIDTIYSLATRNLLMIMWVGVIFNIGYYLLLIYAPTILVVKFQFNQWVSWALAPLVTVGALVVLQLNKSQIACWSLGQFSHLCKDYYELKNSEQRKEYIWEAIRLLSIGPHGLQTIKQTVSKIDWVLKKYPNLQDQMSIRTSKINQRNIYLNFYHKFSAYCYKILIQNFKQNNENKYLLIFYFNELSVERLILFLNKTDFYDIREGERIQRQHRSSDIAAKVHQMMRNQVEITRVLKLYVKKLKFLAETIGDDDKAVDLVICQKIGAELIELQSQILKFGPQNEQLQGQLAKQQDAKHQKIFKNPQVLSAYSFNLLNLVRKQMIGTTKLPKSKYEQKIQEISEILDQQNALIVISAQPGEQGTILGINSAASKLTYYLQPQLIGQPIDMIVPHKIQTYQSSTHAMFPEEDYSYKNLRYVMRKNKYCSLCTVSLRFLDCSMGKRWIVKLHQIDNFSSFIIADHNLNIVGFSQPAVRVGMDFDLLGANLSNYLVFSSHKTEDEYSKSRPSRDIPRTAIIKIKQLIMNTTPGLITSDKFEEIQNLNNAESAKEQSEACKKYQSGKSGADCTILSKRMEQKEQEYHIIKIKDRKKPESIESAYIPDQNKILHHLKQKQSFANRDSKLQNESKKKHRVSLSLLKNEDNIPDTQACPFQFYYHPSIHTLSNHPCSPGEEDWTYNPDVGSEEDLNKEGQKIPHSKTINCDEINELIYINGELQFRENKKLQQLHNCETHPLHLNNRFDDSDKMISNSIDNKSNIYEVMGTINTIDKKMDSIQAPQHFYYPKQHKILIGLLIIFIVLSCSVTLATVICVNEASQAQTKKMETTLLISERSQLYTNLANDMTTYILVNMKLLLNPQYLASRPNLKIVDIFGKPHQWLNLVKEIETKSSMINGIDSIEQQWKDLNLNDVPQLSNPDFGSQLDDIFVDLLDLQKLCVAYPQIDVTQLGNATQMKVNQQLLNNSLLVLRKLVEKNIPIDLYLLSKSQQIYETNISNRIKVIYVTVIVFLVATIILTLVVFCQLRSIHKRINLNLELFTFFPSPSIEAFIKKLNEFDLKINDEKDLTSEIGLEKQNQTQYRDEQLILHKRKIKKNLHFNPLSAICIIGLFVLLALTFFGLLYELVGAIQTPASLDNWFATSNSRLLELNYRWQLRIMREGRIRLPEVNNYFVSSGLNQIPVQYLLKNRQYNQYQTQNLRNFYANKLSPDFQNEIGQFLDKNYCYLDENTQQLVTVCNEKLANFSIDSFESYVQLKQYSLEVLLHQSLDQKNFQKFQSLATFYSKSNGILNDQRLLKLNKEITERELRRSHSKNYINMTTGLVILLGLLILFSIEYVRQVHKLVAKVYTPILILVKCFPLLMLNRNQPFLNWFYVNKIQEHR